MKLLRKHIAAEEEGLCHICESSPCAHVGMRPIRTAANLETLKQNENPFLLMESFLPKERHCFQTALCSPGIFPIYFIFPDSYRVFYTNAGYRYLEEKKRLFLLIFIAFL